MEDLRLVCLLRMASYVILHNVFCTVQQGIEISVYISHLQIAFLPCTECHYYWKPQLIFF